AGHAIRAIQSRVGTGAVALVATHDPRLLAGADLVFNVNRGAIVAQRVGEREGQAFEKIRELKR
ncbi:MAG: hypothetical protein AAFO57_08900, partial [Pseudomonadota bacterium]